jgi:hypothetical protein
MIDFDFRFGETFDEGLTMKTVLNWLRLEFTALPQRMIENREVKPKGHLAIEKLDP